MDLVLLVLFGWGVAWFVARSSILHPARVRLGDWAWESPEDWEPPSHAPVTVSGPALVFGPASPLRPLRAPFRFLSKLLDCAACTGFWIGVAAPFVGVTSLPWWWSGVIVMGVNALADAWLMDLVSAAERRRHEAEKLEAIIEAMLPTVKSVLGSLDVSAADLASGKVTAVPGAPPSVIEEAATEFDRWRADLEAAKGTPNARPDDDLLLAQVTHFAEQIRSPAEVAITDDFLGAVSTMLNRLADRLAAAPTKGATVDDLEIRREHVRHHRELAADLVRLIGANPHPVNTQAFGGNSF